MNRRLRIFFSIIFLVSLLTFVLYIFKYSSTKVDAVIVISKPLPPVYPNYSCYDNDYDWDPYFNRKLIGPHHYAFFLYETKDWFMCCENTAWNQLIYNGSDYMSAYEKYHKIKYMTTDEIKALRKEANLQWYLKGVFYLIIFFAFHTIAEAFQNSTESNDIDSDSDSDSNSDSNSDSDSD